MFQRFRALLLLSLLLCLLSCGGGSSNANPAPPPPLPGAIPAKLFSLSVHSVNDWPTVPFAGLRLWGTGTSWQDINYAPGIFDFSALDRWISAAQAHNTDLIYTFGEVPGVGLFRHDSDLR